MSAAKKKSSKKKRPTNAAKFTKSLEGLPTFYANNTNVTISAYDFKLIFSQIVESTDNKVNVEPQAIVFMSPQHAKAIADLLTKQIRTYEERTGQSL